MPTAAIFKQIESLGYAVSVHRMDGYVEMHAVLLSDPDHQHIARNDDCDPALRGLPSNEARYVPEGIQILNVGKIM